MEQGFSLADCPRGDRPSVARRRAAANSRFFRRSPCQISVGALLLFRQRKRRLYKQTTRELPVPSHEPLSVPPPLPPFPPEDIQLAMRVRPPRRDFGYSWKAGGFGERSETILGLSCPFPESKPSGNLSLDSIKCLSFVALPLLFFLRV